MIVESTYFSIENLKPNLVLVIWHNQPSLAGVENQQWVDAIENILKNATEPQYFFSDLRLGYVTNLTAIRRLTQVIQHSNYGGGVALGQSLGSSTYVNIAVRSAKVDDHIYHHLDRALEGLEQFKAGITHDVDWESVLGTP